MELEKYIKKIDYKNSLVANIEFAYELERRPLWEVLEGLTPEAAIRWAGRFSAEESLSAEWVLAMCLESAFEIEPTARGVVLRALLAELQRMGWGYRYLFRLFKVCGDQYRAEQAFSIVEKITAHLEMLTGSRVLHQMFCIGGVYRDISIGEINKTLQLCQFIEEASLKIFKNFHREVFMRQRLIEGLTLSRAFFEEIGGGGPIAHASGLEWDVRQQAPYAPYGSFKVGVFCPAQGLENQELGKHWHRLQSVDYQCRQSLGLIRQFLTDLPTGDYRQRKKPLEQWPKGDHQAVVEAPSGALRCILSNQRLVFSSVSMKLTTHLESLLTGLDCEDLPLAFYSLGYDFSQGALV